MSLRSITAFAVSTKSPALVVVPDTPQPLSVESVMAKVTPLRTIM